MVDDRSDDGAGNSTQRLDKWLWFARVLKSRTQAAGLVAEGKVRVNKVRVTKPSQSVRAGDVLTIALRGHVQVLKVLQPGERRGPPTEARTLYEDLSPPREASMAGPGARAPGAGRPSKRERRLIDRLKQPE